ncbi:hypothetical protein I79_004752 [Cricetulus griseus]|uniref:Uncharacterized protein n=1 Tax=Cricetulus griseus TaxID=10029 RepID=G3H3D7_CRIGR|nr:hypothetical protein I79_004752 [Cricetulus griseus]
MEAHRAAAAAAVAAGLHSGRLRHSCCRDPCCRDPCGSERNNGDSLVHPASMEEVLEKD